ncbi:hypothetical protein [Sphingomonas sp.]|uniref:hypothetical protein n=1 Tax=Sphingomonas sp. TaxID=28214 RepID=UPI001D200782|nr:hypothetical protein [Sphingomonas sp.]MBX9797395.1 hypothetical protein [Sphingomonas sp.]
MRYLTFFGVATLGLASAALAQTVSNAAPQNSTDPGAPVAQGDPYANSSSASMGNASDAATDPSRPGKHKGKQPSGTTTPDDSLSRPGAGAVPPPR